MAKHAYRFTISQKAELMDDKVCLDYIGGLKGRKEYIHDINVTCKMSPFFTDAHAVIMEKEENKTHIEQMLSVQCKTGIPISLVFNNIYVSNDFETLKEFIKNFEGYYQKGVRSITLPHLLWMKTGEIQKEFPNLYIKSTVLRRVRDGQDFWNLASAGFDCVNIDRLLIRNIEEIKNIKHAQKVFYECQGKYVDISLVVNEGCIGNCAFWEEHYQHSLTSKMCSDPKMNRQGFFLVPQYSGCRNQKSACLSRLNLVGFRQDFDRIFENVDLIKLGGRRYKVNAFKIIDSLLDESVECHPLLQNVLQYGNYEELDMVSQWREKIKNCRYQCWRCNLCSKLDQIIMKYSMLS